jgi:hypothetical protein
MRRLGAALAAILMVLLALYVRSRIDDDGNGSSGGGSAALRVQCSSELADACAELADERDDVEVSVEHAGDTADALADLPDAQRDDVGFDVWLVPEPWPGIVDVRREVNGLEPVFSEAAGPIARSPLVLAVRTDRNRVLEATPECGGTVTWRCVGQLAGRPWDSIGGQGAWGRVRPGHGDPTRDASALAVLSQATSTFLGNEAYSRFDLEENDEYADWLTGLEQAIPPSARTSASPFLDMLQQPAFDAVGTLEAEAGPALANAARDRRREVTLLYPDPVISADVVLAGVAGTDPAAVRDLAAGEDLRRALAESGWRVDGQPRVRGVAREPRLRTTSGLPDAGVLVALQETWGGTR